MTPGLLGSSIPNPPRCLRGYGAVRIAGTGPQSLNRYAYVINNPESLLDPLGMDCKQVVNTVLSGNPATLPPPMPGSLVECGFDEAYSLWSALFGSGGGRAGHPTYAPFQDVPDVKPRGLSPHPEPQWLTPAQTATQYWRDHGELSFNIPFTHIPVNISLSATVALVNYSSTNDISVVLPFTVGASLDVSVDAPPSPLALVSVGSGRNLSEGTFLTPAGPQGLELSVGPRVGSPVTVSIPVANACGLRADGVQ